MGCLRIVHSSPVIQIVLIIHIVPIIHIIPIVRIIPIIHIPHIVLTHRPACYAHSGVVTGLWGR